MPGHVGLGQNPDQNFRTMQTTKKETNKKSVQYGKNSPTRPDFPEKKLKPKPDSERAMTRPGPDAVNEHRHEISDLNK